MTRMVAGWWASDKAMTDEIKKIILKLKQKQNHNSNKINSSTSLIELHLMRGAAGRFALYWGSGGDGAWGISDGSPANCAIKGALVVAEPTMERIAKIRRRQNRSRAKTGREEAKEKKWRGEGDNLPSDEELVFLRRAAGPGLQDSLISSCGGSGERGREAGGKRDRAEKAAREGVKPYGTWAGLAGRKIYFLRKAAHERKLIVFHLNRFLIGSLCLIGGRGAIRTINRTKLKRKETKQYREREETSAFHEKRGDAGGGGGCCAGSLSLAGNRAGWRLGAGDAGLGADPQAVSLRVVDLTKRRSSAEEPAASTADGATAASAAAATLCTLLN
uniref:Uncharacterized protein n=1 Tax=Oryza punctata TaxID=4537 RepID=A0A0E0KZN3_ORYPU